MKNVVVVGSQWGDEGKGKIVDWLSSEADVVVRFQGGHNAGHTLVIDKKVFKLRLLPSGIVRKGKVSILGNGVVIDPWALLSEIEEIKKLAFGGSAGMPPVTMMPEGQNIKSFNDDESMNMAQGTTLPNQMPMRKPMMDPRMMQMMMAFVMRMN